MIKLLFFGDMHGGSKAPKHRKDDFIKTREKKIKEIIQIAKDNKVSALLQAGDFLNKANVAPEYLTKEILNWTQTNLNDLIFEIMTGEKTIKDLEKEIENNIPMVGTIGNHELIGGEIESFDKTSLNMLVQSGFMTLASKDKPIILKDEEEGFTVAITASPYTHNIDDEDKSAYIVDEKKGDYHIHMAHGMLMNKSYGKKFKHTVVSEIAYKTKADLTINGHDHIGYDEIELDNKKFINPGSPVRLSADKKEIKRMPKVLLISIDKGGIEIEPIYLKAEKGSEVLSREHIELKEEKGSKIEEIKSLMNKAGLKKGVDITEIISNLGETKGLEQLIIDEVVADIVESMNKLITPFNPKGAYTIDMLELENFQSHKNSTFEFSSGLNILAGESRNGKSSVLRALRELFDCYMKNPRDAIFFGENYFKITAYLSSGYIISRIVEKKKSGKNGYEIFDPTTGTSAYYNTKGISIVQEILGLNKIKLTEKNKVNVNFSAQGEGWFMLGNNMSAPDRAKLIGVMYGTHYADAVLKDLNAQAKKIVAEINIYEKDINKLTEQKDSYLYLEPLSKIIDEAQTIYDEALLLEETINSAEKLLKENILIEEEIKELTILINSIEKNEKEYISLLEDIKSEVIDIENIEKIIKDVKTIVNDGKQARYVINNLKELDKAKSLVEDIDKLSEEVKIDSDNLDIAKRLEKETTSINLEIKYLKVIEKELVNIEETKSLIDEIKELDDLIIKSSDKIEKAKNIVKEQEVLKNEISINKLLIKELNETEKAQNLLNEIRQLEEQIKESEEVVSELSEIQKEIDITKKEEKKHQEQTLKYLDEYKKELEEMGECPICKGNIDKAIVNNLVDNLSKNIV